MWYDEGLLAIAPLPPTWVRYHNYVCVCVFQESGDWQWWTMIENGVQILKIIDNSSKWWAVFETEHSQCLKMMGNGCKGWKMIENQGQCLKMMDKDWKWWTMIGHDGTMLETDGQQLKMMDNDRRRWTMTENARQWLNMMDKNGNDGQWVKLMDSAWEWMIENDRQ